MASTNDQLICLSHSSIFLRRVEGFASAWAHSVIGTGTPSQQALALSIMADGAGFARKYAGRFTFSDNVMAAGETVTFDFSTENAISSISDANLQSQVNTICVAIAG